MAKDIAVLDCKIVSRNNTRLQRVKYALEKEEIEKQLFDEHERNTKKIIDIFVENWKAFNEMSLSMSSLAPNLSPNEVKMLNVYDFYELKAWLGKKYKPKHQQNADE